MQWSKTFDKIKINFNFTFYLRDKSKVLQKLAPKQKLDCIWPLFMCLYTFYSFNFQTCNLSKIMFFFLFIKFKQWQTKCIISIFCLKKKTIVDTAFYFLYLKVNLFLEENKFIFLTNVYFIPLICSMYNIV